MDILSEEKKSGVFWPERIGRWAFYGLAFLVPLWVLPITAFPTLINKVFLAYGLVLVALIAWLVWQMKAGAVSIPKNFLALALIVFACAVIFSGIFSSSLSVSFDDLSGDPGGVVAIGFFVLAAFLASVYFREEEHILRWLVSFFAGAAALFVFQIIKIVFSLNPVPNFVDLPFKTSNVFGTWTEFGIFLSVAGFIALFLFEVVQQKKFRIALGCIIAASFFTAIAVNSSVIWWTLFAFLIVLFAYLFSGQFMGKNFFRPTLFLLLVTLFFLQAPTFASIFSDRLGTQAVEVRPSFAATWTIIRAALVENPILGSGPGTFLYDWLRFRPSEVVQSSFWDVRFTSGSGFFVSFAGMAGALGIAALLFLVGAFLWYGFRAFVSAGLGKQGYFLALTFISAAMLGGYAVAYNPGFTLLLYLFIFVGMFMGLLASHEITKEIPIKLFANSGVSFIFALAVIGALIGSFSYGYVLVRDYAGAYYYGKSVALFNIGGDRAGATAAISRAIDLKPTDLYYRGLADVKLAELAQILGAKNQPTEVLQAQFQAAAQETIQAAQNAIKINALDPVNWKELAQIYEALVPLGISGVSDTALSTYGEEASRDPKSPEPIFAQARIYAVTKDYAKARQKSEAALALKQNYVPAHLLIAQLEEQAGDLPKAIARMQVAALLNPSEVGTLFQLGLLYYRAEDFKNAGSVFARAVELNPSYSNARYFLGLVDDRLGDKAAALEQFQQVLTLNPGNAEVEQIISNLQAGKKALSGIPSAPENRNTAPVGE